MQQSRTTIVLALAATLVIVVCMIEPSQAQSSGAFSGSRPAGTLFEPTLAFIRQNMRLVQGYVALFRSIFVGAYERPLVTSTDAPATNVRLPSVRVPALDLPGTRLGSASTPRA